MLMAVALAESKNTVCINIIVAFAMRGNIGRGKSLRQRMLDYYPVGLRVSFLSDF